MELTPTLYINSLINMYLDKGFSHTFSKHHVNLPKEYQKILNLAPALNGTFVFLGILGFRRDCLTHFSS